MVPNVLVMCEVIVARTGIWQVNPEEQPQPW